MFFGAVAVKGFFFLLAMKIVGLILSVVFSPVMFLIGLAALIMPSCGEAQSQQQSSQNRRCRSTPNNRSSNNDEAEQLRRFFTSMWNLEIPSDESSTGTRDTANTNASAPSEEDNDYVNVTDNSNANVNANANADATPSSNKNENSRRLNVPAHRNVSDDKMVLTFDLPGFVLEAIDIKFDPETGALSIEGKRTNRLGDSFTVDQTFALDSEEFNVEKIEAHMSEGVLEVTVPKKPKPQPRVISISSTKKID